MLVAKYMTDGEQSKRGERRDASREMEKKKEEERTRSMKKRQRGSHGLELVKQHTGHEQKGDRKEDVRGRMKKKGWSLVRTRKLCVVISC